MTTIKKSSASGDAIYWVETTNSNHRLGFGEGTTGNRGIFDEILGWVFKIDTSNNVRISGTASSAIKLATPRTIWGQPFDGMSDVNGDAHIIGDLVVDGEVSALVA